MQQHHNALVHDLWECDFGYFIIGHFTALVMRFNALGLPIKLEEGRMGEVVGTLRMW